MFCIYKYNRDLNYLDQTEDVPRISSLLHPASGGRRSFSSARLYYCPSPTPKVEGVRWW